MFRWKIIYIPYKYTRRYIVMNKRKNDGKKIGALCLAYLLAFLIILFLTISFGDIMLYIFCAVGAIAVIIFCAKTLLYLFKNMRPFMRKILDMLKLDGKDSSSKDAYDKDIGVGGDENTESETTDEPSEDNSWGYNDGNITLDEFIVACNANIDHQEEMKQYERPKPQLPSVIFSTNYYIYCGNSFVDEFIDTKKFRGITHILSQALSESSFDFRFSYYGLIIILYQSCCFSAPDRDVKAIDQLIFSKIISYANYRTYIARMSLNEFFEFIYKYDPQNDPYKEIAYKKYMEEYEEKYSWHRV